MSTLYWACSSLQISSNYTEIYPCTFLVCNSVFSMEVRLSRKKGVGAGKEERRKQKTRQDKTTDTLLLWFPMFSIQPLDRAQLCCCLKLTERNIAFICSKFGLNMHHLSKFNGSREAVGHFHSSKLQSDWITPVTAPCWQNKSECGSTWGHVKTWSSPGDNLLSLKMQKWWVNKKEAKVSPQPCSIWPCDYEGVSLQFGISSHSLPITIESFNLPEKDARMRWTRPAWTWRTGVIPNLILTSPPQTGLQKWGTAKQYY